MMIFLWRRPSLFALLVSGEFFHVPIDNDNYIVIERKMKGDVFRLAVFMVEEPHYLNDHNFWQWLRCKNSEGSH